MKAYKGFKPDLTCRDFQYVEGESYETSSATLCKTGFHACLMPLDVLRYYPPASSVYHEVEVDDDAPTDLDHSKVASKRIKIGAKLDIAGLVGAQVRWVWERCTVEPGASATGYQGVASATGDRGAASATGDLGAASASGDLGAASATGDQGAASATGDRGAASATGYQGAASATGESSVAMAAGYRGRAMGEAGCVLSLVERDEGYRIVAAKSVIVGKRGIKPGVWYGLHGGKVVPVDQRGEPIAAIREKGALK